jgi:hypothetical protein
MIRQTATKAIVIGVAVLVLANALWLAVLLEVKFHELLRIALLGFPSPAAFLVAYLAPRGKIVLGMSMALWGAIIGVLSTSIYDHLGVPVDHIGGPVAVFFVLLAYQLAYCTVGSVIGYLFWRFTNRRRNGVSTEH